MNNEDRIKLYSLITDKYEVAADEIEKEFGINVGRQLNVIPGLGFGAEGGSYSINYNDRGIMSDEEYFRRYGRPRGRRSKIFFGERNRSPASTPAKAPFRAVKASGTQDLETERSIVSFWKHSAG